MQLEVQGQVRARFRLTTGRQRADGARPEPEDGDKVSRAPVLKESRALVDSPATVSGQPPRSRCSERLMACRLGGGGGPWRAMEAKKPWKKRVPRLGVEP